MTREFIRLPEFEKQCKHIGLTEDDIMKIENELLVNPIVGDIIKGTGGIRKFRVVLPNRGKRGGARVIYVDFVSYNKIYLITVYSKSELKDLTQAERNDLKRYIAILKNELLKRSSYE